MEIFTLDGYGRLYGGHSMAGCSIMDLMNKNSMQESTQSSQDPHITFTLKEFRSSVVPFVTNIRNYLQAPGVDVVNYWVFRKWI